MFLVVSQGPSDEFPVIPSTTSLKVTVKLLVPTMVLVPSVVDTVGAVVSTDVFLSSLSLAQETKSRRVAMKKVQEVQEKFENLLKEKVRMREEQSDEGRERVRSEA